MEKELMEVFEHQRQAVLTLDAGSKESQIATENLIKVTEVIQKSKTYQTELSNHSNQEKKEKIDRWLKFGVEVGKIVIPLAAAIGMGLVSMVWETDGRGTMTNTAGRNSWRDVIRFR